MPRPAVVALSLVVATATVAIGAWSPFRAASKRLPAMAQGYVYFDKNHNQKRDPGEPGLGGVRVSDQTQFAVTDRQGKWSMPVEADQDTTYFVIKPRQWTPPISSGQIPQFYYTHKPNGSPKSKFPGVEPTGPLPESIDFPLYPLREPTKFKALFFGDTQPRDLKEVEYLRRDIVEPIVGQTSASFGVTLGDIAYDDLTVFPALIDTVAMLGIPWHNVIGNHDMNYDAKNDAQSDETYERYFGPNYYSFDRGPVHFVALDNVYWRGDSDSVRSGYDATFGQAQMNWLKQDLSYVPANRLVVLMMHIPINQTTDKQIIYDLIKTRPYCLSVSAHTHFQEHLFLSAKDGYNGTTPHHHVVNVTTCGSWWQGSLDENGIPHSTMRCGAPNGYAIFSFDGTQYGIEFRAARRSADYQIAIESPDSVPASDAKGMAIYANVFGGSERSKVEIRFEGSDDWVAMDKVLEPDPDFVQLAGRDKNNQAPLRPMPDPIPSPHLWKARLPFQPKPGVLGVHVRTRDMFGQTYVASRGILIK